MAPASSASPPPTNWPPTATRSPCSSAAAPSPRKPASPTPAWSRPATSRPGPRPGMPGKVLRYLFSRARAGAAALAAVRARARAGCGAGGAPASSQTYLANRARMQRLAFYSRERLHELTAAPAARLRAQRRLPGAAALASSDAGAGAARPAAAARAGVELPRDRCRRRPRRSSRRSTPTRRLHGAIHLPDDEVGNCRQFALLLQERGRSALRRARSISHTCASCRAAAIAGAAADAALARRAPSDAGTQPHGSAATLRCRRGLRGARLGRAAAAAGPAAAAGAGATATRSARRCATTSQLERGPRSGADGRALQGGDLAPGQARARRRQRRDRRPRRTAQAAGRDRRRCTRCCTTGSPARAAATPARSSWKGARPMLPDGPPVLGASGVPGVWLNLGHGSAAGRWPAAARALLADLIAGRAAGDRPRGPGHRAAAQR